VENFKERKIIMFDTFETNFETLLEETISAAHARSFNRDPEYQKKSYRMSEIHEELEALFENENAKPTSRHWKLVREYFQLEQETYYPEHTATYMQAIFDCVRVFTKYGWLKE